MSIFNISVEINCDDCGASEDFDIDEIGFSSETDLEKALTEANWLFVDSWEHYCPACRKSREEADAEGGDA